MSEIVSTREFKPSLRRVIQAMGRVKSGLTPRRYRFDADTLSLETADGVTLRTPYRTFGKISMGADYILFYDAFPGLAAHVIPSEAFESKEQETIVRHWLGAYAA